MQVACSWPCQVLHFQNLQPAWYCSATAFYGALELCPTTNFVLVSVAISAEVWMYVKSGALVELQGYFGFVGFSPCSSMPWPVYEKWYALAEGQCFTSTSEAGKMVHRNPILFAVLVLEFFHVLDYFMERILMLSLPQVNPEWFCWSQLTPQSASLLIWLQQQLFIATGPHQQSSYLDLHEAWQEETGFGNLICILLSPFHLEKHLKKAYHAVHLSLIAMVDLLNSFPVLIMPQLERDSCLIPMKCAFHELPCWLRKLQLFFLSKQIRTSPPQLDKASEE